MKAKFSVAVLSIAILALLFAGCVEQGEKLDDITTVVVTNPTDGLDYLDAYPALQFVDMRSFFDYEAILNYVSSHPDVEVAYDVDLGEMVYAHDTVELILEKDTFSFELLLQNLKYLPRITMVSFPDTDISYAQMQTLKETYPSLDIVYTVSINGKTVKPDTTDMNLSWLTPKDLEKIVDQLKLITDLSTVELMDNKGSSRLAVTDVKYLQENLPGVFFRYSFDLFGQTVSTEDEVIAYDEVPIGNEGEQTIRDALDILTNCTYFKLDDCGLDNEVMDGIRKDYPDKEIVWRVHIEPFSMLTDETMLRLTFHLEDDMIENLKYLNDVTYLDVGHNVTLTDISFVQYMPKLECVIISGSSVVDTSYFKDCKELVWLEMCFCYLMEDISCVADLPNLKYLNVSVSAVSDLSPLDNVKLERFNCQNTNVSAEEEAAFIEKHPDCWSVFRGSNPYIYGWRYNDTGIVFFDYYANMRKVFRYDEPKYWGNHKE